MEIIVARKMTNDIMENIIEYRKNKLTWKSIAEIVGFHTKSVQNNYRKYCRNGVVESKTAHPCKRRNSRTITGRESQWIYSYRAAGYSWEKISNLLGISKENLKYHARDVLFLDTAVASKPAARPIQEKERPAARHNDDRHSLAAGDPMSWGAISKEPWPVG